LAEVAIPYLPRDHATTGSVKILEINLNMSQIRAVSVFPTLTKAAGGPAFSVSALCEAAANAGVKQSLITFQAPKGKSEQLPNPDLVETIRVGGLRFQTVRFFWSPTFRSTLRNYCRTHGVQVIHSHGIWTQPNHIAASVARELGLPLLISLHGTLEPWAWRHHAWKKRPAWWLWVHRDFKSAVLRATSQKEVEAIRILGLRNPIALIPNGVDLPPASQRTEIRGQTSGVRNALFLSRIHPVKGLLNLVAAWSQVRPAGWRMVVCGPDECGHTQQVKRAVAEAGLSDVFEFKMPAYDNEKQSLYAGADLFVHPTFSENFGLVIAEALSAGVPVITTKGAPWEELRTHECGWWIDFGVEPLAAALREAMALSDDQRRNMGERGRRLVEENYGWPKIGRDMKAVYGWVLSKEPRPECVIPYEC
jgi:glycosyltransferase involved in cell wall biosynthesis